MTIKPLGNRILVLVLEKGEQTESGLFLANTEKERPEQGEVVAISSILGAGIEVGDTVIFKKYAPDEVTLEGKTYFILSHEDVLAIVR